MSVTALTAEPAMPCSWTTAGLYGGDAEQRAAEARIVLGRRGVRTQADRDRERVAVADHDDVDGVAGLEGPNGFTELGRRGHRNAVDRHDLVTVADARSPRGEFLRCHPDDHPWLVLCGDLSLRRVHAEQQHDRDEDVHDRAGADDQQTAREGGLAVRPCLVGRLDVVHPVHADDAHERAERNRPDAVLGLAATEAPQARTEEQEELGGLHAGPLGGGEVAEFVQEDRDDDADDEDEDPDVDERQPCEECREPGHRQPSGPAVREFVVVELGDRAARHDLALDALAATRWSEGLLGLVVLWSELVGHIDRFKSRSRAIRRA